jgi:hypothetical protein
MTSADGCNDDEQAGHQREPEVEAEREAPEARTEYEPVTAVASAA